jgi:hypothetical protein
MLAFDNLRSWSGFLASINRVAAKKLIRTQ